MITHYGPPIFPGFTGTSSFPTTKVKRFTPTAIFSDAQSGIGRESEVGFEGEGW